MKNESLFKYDGSCRRESARVECNDKVTLQMTLGDQAVRILNISAGGLAFNCKQVKPGEKYELVLELPGAAHRIEGYLIVLEADSNGDCHAKFEGLTDEMKDAIHNYVLHQQLEQLRRKKAED